MNCISNAKQYLLVERNQVKGQTKMQGITSLTLYAYSATFQWIDSSLCRYLLIIVSNSIKTSSIISLVPVPVPFQDSGFPNVVFWPTDTRPISDQHHFNTDIIASHQWIFLPFIILKQFVEMLHTKLRLLFACERIGEHVVKIRSPSWWASVKTC